jgi:hypothetical protein
MNSMDIERQEKERGVQPAAAVAKKQPGPAKRLKTYNFITVDKNYYSQEVSKLANNGATIYAVTTNPDVRNSYDVHYFTVA